MPAATGSSSSRGKKSSSAARSARRIAKDPSKQKHIPKHLSGETFSAANNPHISNTPITHTPEPGKLDFILYTDKDPARGIRYTYPKIANFDWTNETSVQDANRWYYQIRRRLGILAVRGGRKHWTLEEIRVIANHPEFDEPQFSEAAMDELTSNPILANRSSRMIQNYARFWKQDREAGQKIHQKFTAEEIFDDYVPNEEDTDEEPAAPIDPADLARRRRKKIPPANRQETIPEQPEAPSSPLSPPRGQQSGRKHHLEPMEPQVQNFIPNSHPFNTGPVHGHVQNVQANHQQIQPHGFQQFAPMQYNWQPGPFVGNDNYSNHQHVVQSPASWYNTGGHQGWNSQLQLHQYPAIEQRLGVYSGANLPPPINSGNGNWTTITQQTGPSFTAFGGHDSQEFDDGMRSYGFDNGPFFNNTQR